MKAVPYGPKMRCVPSVSVNCQYSCVDSGEGTAELSKPVNAVSTAYEWQGMSL